MIWTHVLLSLAAISTAVQGYAISPRAEYPGGQVGYLPFPVEEFSMTVASVQNTYCAPSLNVPGTRFGDQTLLYAVGDGDLGGQRTNIYHSESLGIIVAYEGTNITSLQSIINDLDAIPVLPSSEFNLPQGSLVFNGWQLAFCRTWFQVKLGLRNALAQHPNANIVVTGHSQGAGIATLAALAIETAFPGKVDKIITYGPPRVGNPKFADAFDSVFIGKYTGVSNGKDWVQNLPSQAMGYRHPTGIVWINPANSTSWVYFNQQEPAAGPNSVPLQIFYPGTLTFDFDDHQGIYMHSSMGVAQGPCPAKVGGY